MRKTANPARDRETEHTKMDGERGRRREIRDERAPAASREEGSGKPAVSPADDVLDPSLNESSRH